MANDIGQHEILVGAVSDEPVSFAAFETSILMKNGKSASWWSFPLDPKAVDGYVPPYRSVIKKHPYLYLYFGNSRGQKVFYRYPIIDVTKTTVSHGQECPKEWRKFIRRPGDESGTIHPVSGRRFKVWFLTDDLEEVPNGIPRSSFVNQKEKNFGKIPIPGQSSFGIWKLKTGVSEEFQFRSMVKSSHRPDVTTVTNPSQLRDVATFGNSSRRNVILNVDDMGMPLTRIHSSQGRRVDSVTNSSQRRDVKLLGIKKVCWAVLTLFLASLVVFVIASC